MEKITFAKIFEFEENQVLITKENKEEEGIYQVVQTTDFKDVRPSLALGFENEDKRNKCFDNYNKDNAKKFLQIILEMLK